MPELHAANNVLPFSPQPSEVERNRQVPLKSRELLDMCRDRLAHGVATAFAENLTQIYDNLIRLAERTASLERQHLYFATQRFLTARSQELLEQFRSSFVKGFDQHISSHGQDRNETAIHQDNQLSLVDETDFERELAIGKLTSRATYNCSHQLMALNRRMAVLMQVPQVGQDDNPLYPKFVFDALLDAIRTLAADEQIELSLLQQFELHTSGRLPTVYQTINQYLVENGILPTIPLGSEPTADAAPQAQAGGQGNTPPTGSGGTADPAAHEADVFAQLVDRLQGTALPAGPGTSRSRFFGESPWSAFDGAAFRDGNALGGTIGQPAYLGHEAQPVSQSQLVETLTELQKGRPDAVTLPGVDTQAFDPGMVHVLQRIRSAPQVSQSHPMDVLTLDIVALLFDVIFKDSDFPVTLRAEIGKLQIPMLKVALMDKGFFANRLHPARKLLDLMAGAAVGWSDGDQSRLLGEIRDIIDVLIATFDNDTDVFADQVERLEAFLEQEEQRATKNTEVMATEMEKRDRKEFAQRTADTEIERRVQNRGVPIEIVDFLKDSWRLVLIGKLLRGDKGSEQWAGSVQTMDDLIWSVAPKHDVDERNRLMAMLPDLLERLRAGLESVSLESGWQAFFSVLIRLHMETLHPNAESVPDAHEDDQATADEPTIALDPLAGTAKDADATAASARKSDDAESDRYMALAKSLEIGSWVEFRTKRGKQSLRLSWVSGMRGVYLFTNRNGMNALSVAVTRLADHLRKGAARVHRPSDLTERAVKSLLGNQSGKSGR